VDGHVCLFRPGYQWRDDSVVAHVCARLGSPLAQFLVHGSLSSLWPPGLSSCIFFQMAVRTSLDSPVCLHLAILAFCSFLAQLDPQPAHLAIWLQLLTLLVWPGVACLPRFTVTSMSPAQSSGSRPSGPCWVWLQPRWAAGLFLAVCDSPFVERAAYP